MTGPARPPLRGPPASPSLLCAATPLPLPAAAAALPSPLHAQALARPHHVALRCGQQALSYGDWAKTCDARAAELLAAGVRPGEVVALFGQASLALACEIFAVRAAGAIPAVLAPTGPDVAQRLAAVGPRWFSVLPGTALDVAAAGQGSSSPAALPPAGAASPRPAAPYAPAAWDLAGPWCVLATSGSTGRPRAVALAGLQVLTSAFAVAGRLGSLPQDTWLACLPWHHVGGLMVLLRTVLLGTQAIVEAPFDAGRVASLLDGGAISLAPMVPTMLSKVLAVRPQRPFAGRLRAIVLGGAPPSAALLASAEALALPLAVSWGMTEASSQLATRFVYAKGGPSDAGPPLTSVSVSARGGALVAEGPLVGGELVTADRGCLDAEGHVQVLGRADDLLLSGGENVAVEPIEAALEQHPAIAEAAVVGRPDALWGERPVAHLVFRPPAGAPQRSSAKPAEGLGAPAGRPSDQQLLAFCRGRLASSQLPVQFVWQAALPRDPLGKLRRRLLRNKGEES